MKEAADLMDERLGQFPANGPAAVAMNLGYQALRKMEESEASFRDVHWLPRQARAERLGESIAAWYGDRSTRRRDCTGGLSRTRRREVRV